MALKFSAIGLEQSKPVPYFCTPLGAEYVGCLGCDGIHFVLLPGDERVFCVDPAMGEPGTYVLPVAADLREFLSFVLFCRDANPLSQIWWLSRERFDALLNSDAEARWEGCETYLEEKEVSLNLLSEFFGLTPQDPYERVRAMQADFDPSCLVFPMRITRFWGWKSPETGRMRARDCPRTVSTYKPTGADGCRPRFYNLLAILSGWSTIGISNQPRRFPNV